MSWATDMSNRICKKCNKQKLLKDFVFRKDVPNKRKHICKKCHNTYNLIWKQTNKKKINKSNLERYYKNRKKYKATNLKWQQNNKEKVNKKSQMWRLKNPKKVKEVLNNYRLRNLDKDAAKTARRRATILKATPKWADLAEIVKVYQRSYEISKQTGIKHHVDHIIPLKGKNISGLHVQWNLQILTKKQNLKKSNKMGVLLKCQT